MIANLKRVSLTICCMFLLLISLQPCLAFIFDDEFVERESGGQDTIRIREEFTQEEMERMAIDPEDDLLLSEIKDVFIVMALSFFGVIIISLVAALKSVSPTALIVGVGLAMVFSLLVGGFYAIESTMLFEILGDRDGEFWEGVSADSFNLSNVADLGEPSRIASSGGHIVNMLNLRAHVGDDMISNASLYRWETDDYTRDVFILEFMNEIVSRSFREYFFIPVSEERVRGYVAQHGLVDSATKRYRRGFLMLEDRFVILVFGTEMHSKHAMARVLNHFPERHWIADENPPIIEVLETDDDDDKGLKIRLSDKMSGVDPMSLQIKNLDTGIDPLKDCREEKGTELNSYICSIGEISLEETGPITIIVSDYEMNNAKKNLG